MTPMTPEQRGEARFYVPPGTQTATPELVASVACGIRALEMTTRDPAVTKLSRDGIAVIRRLLDAEQQLATTRRVIAEAVAHARDLPDYGLGAGDILHLLNVAGLDLGADIEAAETIRHAEQTAGAPR